MMKYGSTGQEVRRLQRALKINVTGKFGRGTQQALKEYQKSMGLVVDGIAGPSTLSALGIEVLAGIDVSDYNRIFDWQAMYDHGVRWCYVKASEGTSHDQKKAHDHAKRARDVGMDVGFYHFSRPDTNIAQGMKDAQDEVGNLLDDLVGVPYTLSFCNDMEKGDEKRDEYNVRWTIEFARELNRQIGHTPLLYTAYWFVSGWYNDDELKDVVKTHKLWLADYDKDAGNPAETAPWDEWTFLQWTGFGYIPGSTGKIDLNWAAGGALDKVRLHKPSVC